MPNIIEQLEEGKKLQEEGNIDVESLRTKIGSSEEEQTEKPKRRRKKKEQPQENIQKDPFEQAEEIINKSSEPKVKEPIEQKPEKYPGFDFNDYYEKGQKIFYVQVSERLGEKDLLELTIRTIYPKMMVAVEEKKCAHCIGADSQDMIFFDRKSAVEAYNDVDIKTFKEEPNIEVEDSEE